jgi:hypothetical protein
MLKTQTATDTTLSIIRPADHAHRWVIEEPNGPISRGRCKICRQERDFKNWLSETDFITNEEYRQTAA